MNDLFLGDIGKEIIVLLQSFSPLLDIPFLIITLLGDEILFIALIAGIYWSYSKRTGINLFFLMGLMGILNVFLKGLFGIPRPFQTYPNEITNISGASGYSFPSGHSMGSTTFFGYVATLYRSNLFIVGLSVIFIMLVSLSRVYLGVHYPSDIITGIVIGLAVIFVFIRLSPSIERFVTKQSDFMLTTLVLLVSLGLMLISTLVTEIFSNNLEIASNGPLTGLLAGGTIGFLLERKTIAFNIIKTPMSTKLIRLFFGYFILLTIYILGKALFSTVEGNIVIITDYMRYFVFGFGSTYIVPYVFNKFEKISTTED
ncbi:MAG: phosphatase PAP2 family protein [Candidatus Hodarchaeales archaeon]|jgi:membrane-associated phospholipid phosphatase